MSEKIIHLHETLPILPCPRARAVIDTEALSDNYKALLAPIQAVSPLTAGIAVVKADAYGHGIRPAAHTLIRAGCKAFAVACPEEAVALRRILRADCPTPVHTPLDEPMILILGYSDPAHAPCLAAYNLTATLLSDIHAAALAEAARALGVTLSVHAALDTGMNRIGYPAHTEGEIAATAAALLARFGMQDPAAPLHLDGIFTHFARADEDEDTEMRTPDSRTLCQLDRFRRVREALLGGGLVPRLSHICNSAASVRFPDAHPNACFDAVRLGINLYGYGVASPRAATRPAMRLETAVTHVHDLLPGEEVGYGGSFVSAIPRRLVTLPIGYADGWIRALTGAAVTLHTPAGDYPAPIVGRICMDQCMADVTDLSPAALAQVAVGTPVTLFGQTPDELEALAARAGTISYELLCLITARVPRVYREK